MKGRNDPTAFLPLKTKIDGPVKCVKDKENIYLMRDNARHVDKKVELEGIGNIDTMKQEIEEDKLSRNNIDDEEEVNPYHNIIINNTHRKSVITSQVNNVQCLVMVLIM